MNNATAASVRTGLRDVSPVLLGIFPFGLIYGVTAAASSVDHLAAWAASFIIFAGASQLAILGIMGTTGAAVTAIITAIIINSRQLMYSAGIGRYTADEPVLHKIPFSYLLTDQVYLLTVARFRDPREAGGYLPYYFAAALMLWSTWQIATTTGFLLGNFIPDEWRLEFAIPMTFTALLVLTVRTRPGLVAATVGGAVAVAGIDLPYGLGLLSGAVAGIAAGIVSERWLDR